MTELKPCPFCGGKATINADENAFFIRCEDCWATSPHIMNFDYAVNSWNKRADTEPTMSHVYDKEETYSDCTVQILSNTVTGETSVGWWKNE